MITLFKRLGKGFLWGIVLLYLIVFFIPKSNLYYLGESFLAKEKIYINGETAADRGWQFALHDAGVIYQGIRAATIPEVSLTTLLVYNSLSVAPFAVSDELSGFLPPQVEAIRITHSLLAPHKLSLYAKGDFGEVTGEVNLLNRTIQADMKISSVMQKNYGAMLRQLKKTKEGYRYASSF